ncbi:MAG TPA: hypothetical protein PK878_06870 [bacterium]|nr:hypothetical protein [Candidatus Omnitrophota bacterium]HOJ59993.1 hypothetical protein [bacterium]HOL93822.1 hypothetical protein [bacterium]HPO99776.1 hypothetical protein [bacterium]HXK94901.1 hypothetical protein [bacterium]
MRVPIRGLFPGKRAYEPIPEEQAEKIKAWWHELGGDPERLVIDCSSGSRCRLDEAEGVIYVGADINPGEGTDPNSSMRWRAALAHELRHLQRFDTGCQEEPGPLDEALTDLEACAYPQLPPAIRDELAADALQRLYQYINEMKQREKE